MRTKLPFFSKDIWLLILLAVIVHLLYFRTATAGFVTDFTGLSGKFERGQFWDFLTCFGFPAMEQLRHLFLWVFYKVFGIHSYGWYFVFSTFHILNAWLVFKLGAQLFQKYEIKNAIPAAIAASILFAVCPYNVEPLVWRVNFVFLFITFLTLYILRQYLFYTETKERKHLWRLQSAFVLGLFTFELALITPILLSAFILFDSLYKNSIKEFFQKYAKLVLPQVGIIGIYFILQKIIFRAWVGHYGAETHLNFDPTLIFGNLLKYTSKYLVFSRNIPHQLKDTLYSNLDSPWAWGTFMFSIVLAFIYSIVKWEKLTKKAHLAWIFAAFYFVALLPILNIFFFHVLHIENDRYGYLPSVFLYLLLVLLLSNFPKWLSGIIVGIYLVFSIQFTLKNTNSWASGDKVFRGLLEDYRWQEAENVYVLTVPDNFEGAGMFRRYRRQDSSLRDALEYMYDKNPQGNLHEIAHFNQRKLTGDFTAEKDSTGLITLKFAYYGSWFWDCGHGTSGYETDDFEFRTKGMKAKIRIKNPKPDDIVIFSNGTKWEEIK